ncbi:hypothetical protein AaE_005341, partial [Aphanomyces astaci]
MDIAPDRRLTVHMSAMDADDFEKMLATAIDRRDAKQVEALLSQENVNAEVFHGPVLVRSFVAAACSDTSIFHLLVQANFNVNAVDDVRDYYMDTSRRLTFTQDGDTALMVAARGIDSKLYTDEDIPVGAAFSQDCATNVRLLLEAKADVNVINKSGETALFQAVNYGGDQAIVMVKMLLEGDLCHVDVQDEDGLTPLHVAVKRGQADIVALLINRKSNVHAKTSEGKSPLHLACQYGHFAVVEILVKYQPVLNELTEDRQTPLILAASCGSMAIVRLLLDLQVDVTIKDK